MTDALSALKTDPALLDQLAKVAEHKSSAQEVMEQRVSFVYGLVKPANGLTKADVRRRVHAHYGMETGAES